MNAGLFVFLMVMALGGFFPKAIKARRILTQNLAKESEPERFYKKNSLST